MERGKRSGGGLVSRLNFQDLLRLHQSGKLCNGFGETLKVLTCKKQCFPFCLSN